jgi:GPH family glycoside/pentoside/hexuronide:cation symporter
MRHHVTAPEDRVPLPGKIGYGTGMLGYALMIQVYMQFCYPVFNDTLGLSPVLISTVFLVTRFWDALTDPLMGSVTDNTRTRWGRRRPWLAAAAPLCALSFLAVWWFPFGQSSTFYFGWLLGASLFFYLAFTVFSVPYSALGMELSPDYHERTSVISIRTVIEQLGFFVVASLFYLTSLDRFADRADGMRWNSLWVAGMIFVVILIPAVFSREHPAVKDVLKRQDELKNKQKIPLLLSIKETLSCRPFLSLGLITVFSYPGVVTVGSLGYYVTIYHLFGGDKGPASGALMSIVGYTMPLATMIAIPLMGGLSKKIGKRNALIASFSLCTLGCILRWPLYTPEYPYLSIIPTVLFGIGTAAGYLFINAMIPEAVDADELKTGERREGMFSAAYGWTYKLGAALAMWLSGYVLKWTGFDARLESQTPETIFWLRFSFTWVAAISLLITVLLVFTYPITEKKAYEIRQQLIEMRRRKNSAEENHD